MSVIAVTALLVVKPGKDKTFESLLAPLVAATRAEQGCLSYVPHRTEQTGHYCILEQWKSQAHLDQHLATAHIETFRKASVELMDCVKVTVWEPFDPA